VAIAAAVFIGVVQFLAWLIANHPHSRWSLFAGAIPIFVVAAVIVVAMSSLKGMDEREARMHLEALAFAFLASQLLLSTYAFMAYTGLVRLQLEMFMPMMVLLWLAGLARSLWKYR
jgi:hypothetical protein